jgi:hypothetical protein
MISQTTFLNYESHIHNPSWRRSEPITSSINSPPPTLLWLHSTTHGSWALFLPSTGPSSHVWPVCRHYSTHQDLCFSLIQGSDLLGIRRGIGFALASKMSVEGTWVTVQLRYLRAECISLCCVHCWKASPHEVPWDQSLLHHWATYGGQLPWDWPRSSTDYCGWGIKFLHSDALRFRAANNSPLPRVLPDQQSPSFHKEALPDLTECPSLLSVCLSFSLSHTYTHTSLNSVPLLFFHSLLYFRALITVCN